VPTRASRELDCFITFTDFKDGFIMITRSYMVNITSQNVSNLTVSIFMDAAYQDPEAKLVVDFSIFLIVGPIFIVFCIFVLWWDFFHGARVVPNCLYFSNPWNSQTDAASQCGKQSVRRPVELYSTRDGSQSDTRDGSQSDTRPNATNAAARDNNQVHPASVPQPPHVRTEISSQHHNHTDPCTKPIIQRQRSSQMSSARVSYSSSLPNMLTHRSSLMQCSNPTTPKVKRKCVTVKTGISRNRSNSNNSESGTGLRYRDPTYARVNKHGRQSASTVSPSTKLEVRHNVVLSKLSIERRAPPMWDTSYSKPKQQQQTTVSESPGSDGSEILSEHSLMLKVRSLDLKRRMTTFFPDENLARYSSLPKISVMSKSATCDVLLKSRLEDFIPDEVASEIPTSTPSVSNRSAISEEGTTTHHINSSAVSISTLQLELQKVENQLKSELMKVEEKIETVKNRKSFTKEELKAKLSEFIPEAVAKDDALECRSEISDSMPSAPSLEEIRSVKSDCPRRRISQKKKDLPPVNHQRSNTWQFKSTLYE